jgi:ketosteroid isomerase-like protein
MSEENVNLVRGMYAGFARGDIPAVLATFHPQVEWWEAEISFTQKRIRMLVQMKY